MSKETCGCGHTTDEDLVCQCGNRPDLDGFFPCLTDGTQVEPILDGPWDGTLYVCARCETIHTLT